MDQAVRRSERVTARININKPRLCLFVSSFPLLHVETVQRVVERVLVVFGLLPFSFEVALPLRVETVRQVFVLSLVVFCLLLLFAEFSLLLLAEAVRRSLWLSPLQFSLFRVALPLSFLSEVVIVPAVAARFLVPRVLF